MSHRFIASIVAEFERFWRPMPSKLRQREIHCGEPVISVQGTNDYRAEYAQARRRKRAEFAEYVPIRGSATLAGANRISRSRRLSPKSYDQVSGFWPQYLRGQAYLLLRNGTAAAAEFQQILDNRCRGILSPLYPLAHVGLARASALIGNRDASRRAYEAFFALWRESDADLPILQETRKEFQRLQRD